MSTEKLLTAQEVAEILGLSVETIWRYTREEKIPFLKLGPRQYRYRAQDVLDSLSKGDAAVGEEETTYSTDKKFTYADYAKLPPEMGYSIQLIEGVFVREPSPRLHHQRVSFQLQFELRIYFQEVDPGAEILAAPLDLYLTEHTVVQPDLLYFSSSRPPRQTPVRAIPELIIEILSPTSSRLDQVQKLNLYQKAQIPHYWIVDPAAGFIHCYELQGAHYVVLPPLEEDDFSHPGFPGLSFSISTLLTKPAYSLE